MQGGSSVLQEWRHAGKYGLWAQHWGSSTFFFQIFQDWWAQQPQEAVLGLVASASVPVSLQLLSIGHFSPIGCLLILMGTEKWDLGIHGNFRDSSATKHPLSSVIALHTPTSLLISSHCKIVMMTQELPLSFSGCYCAMLILSEIKTSSSI